MSKRIFLLGATALASINAPAVYALENVRADEIIVTASPVERAVAETIIGTSVIGEEELQRRLENSIGETLRREPGVSSTFFGPGASRPVIRGLGGDRISVLDTSIGSIDASSTSPDHAAAVEPAMAERIEIVRGSGTLLYGSSAAGGVVNVFSGKIPRQVPEGGMDGALRIGRSTVDDGIDAAGGFDAALAGLGAATLVFHGEGFYRKADDYKIPGFAESAALRAEEEAEHDDEDADEEHHEEEVFGIAENSALETKGGAAGLSLVFDNAHFGVSVTSIDTTYGVPGGHHHHEEEGEGEGEAEDAEEEEEGGVLIDLKQRRFDVDGEIGANFLLFEKTRLRFGYADYEHAEIEPSGEVGTLFLNDGWEGRVEFVDRTMSAFGGEIDGALGFQVKRRDFSAIGEEAFVPPTVTNQFGVFALKEYARGVLRLEAGGRFENTDHETATGEERSFDALSVSAGIGVTPSENIFFGVTGFRTERAPSTEELFSNGPHLATQAFELGDPDLGLETGRGVEATLRLGNDSVSFVANGFYTSYRDFIYETPTGAEEDGLPVFQFQASDAKFRGFEAQLEAEMFQLGAFDIHGDAALDYVRADTDASGDLPRIPPLSALIGLEANSDRMDLRAEAEFAADQDRTATAERPTDGYTVFNMFMTLRPFERAGLALQVAANNITNEEVRLHTSFLKDLVPLPGRNIKVSLRGEF